jgi:hypothetical protein
VSLMVSGSTLRGFRSRIARSASLPGTSDPLAACSPWIMAGTAVIARSASYGLMRSSGPRTRLFWKARLTMSCMERNRLGPAPWRDGVGGWTTSVGAAQRVALDTPAGIQGWHESMSGGKAPHLKPIRTPALHRAHAPPGSRC